MSSPVHIPLRSANAPVTVFGPDFPFAYDDWLAHPTGLGELPSSRMGTEVAIIGGGMAGMVAAHELMKLGLKPVVYEAAQLGGRLRSQAFEGGSGAVAELGGMRFPRSSTGFFHYVRQLGVQTRPFPNPLTPAAGCTVIDLEGQTHWARTLADLPPLFAEVAQAWSEALEEGAGFTEVGFGTGGWDSDFPNSMLEILRVVLTGCDEDQHLMVGGAQQVPLGLWRHAPEAMRHWPAGTTLARLHGGAPRPGVRAIERAGNGALRITDQWGSVREYPAALVTCQSWLLTTQIACEESLFSQRLWMALDRTRYMQSSKTFVMVDHPFWNTLRHSGPQAGWPTLGMTLTDRLTRGTYLFDNGPDQPGVICLSYAWMSDALKMLPHSPQRRVELALSALRQIYPDVDIASHIVGDPITVSWEADPHFLGAFKGALPGHYRYNHRMYTHFMQDDLPEAERGIFIAGDDVSFTPAWVEGAVQTALNAVWGMVRHLGGRALPDNPGPGEAMPTLGPMTLPD